MIRPVDEFGNQQDSEIGQYQPRIIVKFCEPDSEDVNCTPLDVPYEAEAHNHLMDVGGETWREVLEEYRLQLNTPFTAEDVGELEELTARAQQRCV